METHGQVHVVTSVEDYARQLLNSATAGRLTVVDFSAAWCGPCVNIAPVFAELSTKYAAGADFLKVDIDEHKELAAAAGVTALPTFHFMKSGVKVESLTGANSTKLEQLIKKHLAGTAGADDDILEIPQGQGDLTDVIDQSHGTCLNQQSDHIWTNILTKDAKYLESDCDPQLLIYIPFKQNVKINSICFVAPNDGKGPRTVKLFANNPHMDFQSVDNASTQDLELASEDLKEDTLTPLKFLKFQNVASLTIFVEDNQGGDDTTVISRLRIIGQPHEASDMSQFKRVVGEKNEA